MKFKTLGSIALTILLVSGFSGCSSNDNSDNNDKVDTTALGYQTIADDGTITYVDYTGGTRQAAPTAAAAEYHTGVGYGNTLFDSAENKCQNCHNELYDTWEGSMHGRSWSDPVFQGLFQSYLRTQLSRIDRDNSEVPDSRPYTEGVFINGSSQACITCHAPGAYYAGDVKVTVSEIADAEGADLNALRALHENSDHNGEIAVITANPNRGKILKATFQIGHEANREGINCAFCHSIETPRLMGLGHDGDQYTLARNMHTGPDRTVRKPAGETLHYNKEATNPDMNKFFRLWGPESYHNNASTSAHTPKNLNDFDVGKVKDGRYTMASKDINGTDGKTHFTGGPFYGPYGVTGISNENESDDTNRSAHVNPNFHYNDGFNHFGDQGKALCLSCHQRSAGAWDGQNGEFMELCSTWNAVTTGQDNNHEDTDTSPKCQECHMERIEGTVLHKWAKPDELFTDKSVLTPHFFPDNAEGVQDNPVADKWLDSHAFLGASKTGGDPAAAVVKIKSGFDADISSSVDGDTLTVTTTFTNKTAHMLPGAHPMRRMLTRLIVTDSSGEMLKPITATGLSTFGTITNNLVTLSGKKLANSQSPTVTLYNGQAEELDFTGKVKDLNGSRVTSEAFYSDIKGKITIPTPELSSGTIVNGAVRNEIFNASILDSNATEEKFTRIYGHQTGNMFDINGTNTYVVRPGFDSRFARRDARLSPNETETYTLTYDISGKTGVKARYDVYYMQKGANGQFDEAEDGFLDQAASDAKKHMVTKVFSKTVGE